MMKSPSDPKAWQAVEILRAYAMYRRLSDYEFEFVNNLYETNEKHLSPGQIDWLQNLYKKHIDIEGW